MKKIYIALFALLAVGSTFTACTEEEPFATVTENDDPHILAPVFPDRTNCLLYTSDAADDLLCVDLGGRRIPKKKKNKTLSLIHICRIGLRQPRYIIIHSMSTQNCVMLRLVLCFSSD